MPNNGLLNIDGNVIDSTPPDEIADIVADAVADAVSDLDSTLVHKAGDGTTPEEITGIKDFSYGHDSAQDDNNPSVRAARLRITGQVAPTASQKSVSQVDFYIDDDNIAYMGCTRQNGATFVKVASNNDSVPLIFGYKPFQDNTACIRFEKNKPVWRGGQTGTYSEDKALAVVGDIDPKIDDRFALNPPTANRVLVSDANGKIAPSSMTTTELDALSALSDILTPKQFTYTNLFANADTYLTDPNGTYFNSNGKCLIAGLYCISACAGLYSSTTTGYVNMLMYHTDSSGNNLFFTGNRGAIVSGTNWARAGVSATRWISVGDIIKFTVTRNGAASSRDGYVSVVKII